MRLLLTQCGGSQNNYPPSHSGARQTKSPWKNSNVHTPHVLQFWYSGMELSFLCRAFFGLGAVVSIGGILLPSFRTHIMNYGSRSTTITTSSSKPKESKDFIDRILRVVGSVQIPHSWFTHYYVVSVLSSCFWGYQIYTRGTVFKFLASHSHQGTNMTVNHVVLAWTLMLAQGIRRLYESLTLTKPSQSKMWVGLWVIGMGYYIFIGIAVWIEGISG